MVQTLHLGLGRTLARRLECQLNEKWLATPFNFAYGKLLATFSDAALAQKDREQHRNSTWSNYTVSDMWKYLHTDWSQFSKIIIWHDDASLERKLLLGLLCKIIPGDVYELNGTEMFYGLNPDKRSNPNTLMGRHEYGLIDIAYGDAIKYAPYVKLIDSDRKKQYADMWDYWCLHDGGIRMYNGNREIISLPLDYFDQKILSYFSRDYQCAEAAYELGSANGEYDPLPFPFIQERIIHLVQNKQLEVCQKPTYKRDKSTFIVDDIDYCYMSQVLVRLPR